MSVVTAGMLKVKFDGARVRVQIGDERVDLTLEVFVAFLVDCLRQISHDRDDSVRRKADPPERVVHASLERKANSATPKKLTAPGA